MNLFVYGILKRGFPLDLRRHGAEFLGEARIKGAKLLKINEGVGLRWSNDPFEVAYGEIFSIPDDLWPWLDAIESNGQVYTRTLAMARTGKGFSTPDEVMQVQVYLHTYYGADKYEKLPVIEGGRFK
jgi:gamma-glutamylcyclotransferase (GGCT)/AIG2-like uncharacterized protein YtfP